MKLSLLHRWLIALVLPLLGACADDLTAPGPEAEGNVLVLTLATQASTRATEPGDDVFNENYIAQADVYFFPTAAETDGSQQCQYVQTGLTPARASDAANGNARYNLQVPLDPATFTNGQYYVYVVANPQAGSMAAGTVGTTLDGLKQQVLTTEWTTGYAADGTGLSQPTATDYAEDALVMGGGLVVDINLPQAAGDTRAVIPMTRAMAKVVLSASTTTEDLEVDGRFYRANPTGMYVTLAYSVGKGNLAGDYAVQAPTDYITRQRRNFDTTPETVGERDRYTQLAPFYSYPNPAGTTDRRDTYLILCVPWRVYESAEDESFEVYDYFYRVPVTGTDAPALLLPNHYYKINVHIGVLGSLNPRDAVEVKAKFEIMDWFEAGIDADMQKYRYLVLDSYRSELNNQNTLDMPYISSSNIAWPDNPAPNGNYTRITQVKYWDYSQDTSREVKLPEDYEEGDPISFDEFQISQGPDGTLRFTHTLNEEIHFVPFEITVEVWNTQGVQAPQQWVITQYPAMYIVGENNNTNESYGGTNRFVNGYNSTRDTPYDDGSRNRYELGSISELGGNNYNPNLYTIHTSSFDDNTYLIGDPRGEENYQFAGTLRQANEYRATRRDAENIVAPAFKVASSWGKTTDISYDEAVMRCASYQEAGYPAGRWRIPTRSEVAYITGLSTEQKIPRLFGSLDVWGNEVAATYWVSSGKYTAGDPDEADYYTPDYSGNEAVRCVYDVWYWGDATIEEDTEHNTGDWNNNQFVWGDAPDGTLERGTEH